MIQGWNTVHLPHVFEYCTYLSVVFVHCVLTMHEMQNSSPPNWNICQSVYIADTQIEFGVACRYTMSANCQGSWPLYGKELARRCRSWSLIESLQLGCWLLLYSMKTSSMSRSSWWRGRLGWDNSRDCGWWLEWFRSEEIEVVSHFYPWVPCSLVDSCGMQPTIISCHD